MNNAWVKQYLKETGTLEDLLYLLTDRQKWDISGWELSSTITWPGFEACGR